MAKNAWLGLVFLTLACGPSESPDSLDAAAREPDEAPVGEAASDVGLRAYPGLFEPTLCDNMTPERVAEAFGISADIRTDHQFPGDIHQCAFYWRPEGSSTDRHIIVDGQHILGADLVDAQRSSAQVLIQMGSGVELNLSDVGAYAFANAGREDANPTILTRARILKFATDDSGLPPEMQMEGATTLFRLMVGGL